MTGNPDSTFTIGAVYSRKGKLGIALPTNHGLQAFLYAGGGEWQEVFALELDDAIVWRSASMRDKDLAQSLPGVVYTGRTNLKTVKNPAEGEIGWKCEQGEHWKQRKQYIYSAKGQSWIARRSYGKPMPKSKPTPVVPAAVVEATVPA